MQNRGMCKDSVIKWGYQVLNEYEAENLRKLVMLLSDVPYVSYVMTYNGLVIGVPLHCLEIRISSRREVAIVRNKNSFTNLLSLNDVLAYFR